MSTAVQITFTPINQPSSSKGWLRFKATAADKPVIQSRTGNAYVSAAHSGDVEAGTLITLTTQVMLRSGKGRMAKETISTETYTLVAEPGASCTPGSREASSGINGVTTTYMVGGYVTVDGARLATSRAVEHAS